MIFPFPWCILNIEYYEPEGDYYWHARIGSIFEDAIAHARLCEREWAITAKKSDSIIIIAQSKQWRDRSGNFNDCK